MKDIIELCELNGISGFEFEISKYIEQLFAKHCEYTETDALGNVIGVMGRGSKTKIMLEAHMDEVGLIVKSIDENGFVGFVCIGGISASILPSAEVCIHGKEPVYGVIGATPPHLQRDDESKKLYKIEEMYIDTGYLRDELIQKIQIGDPISFECEPDILQNNMLAAKSIDNRMGIACLVRCMERLKNEKLNREIVFLAAVQEEVGCRGAKVGAYRIDPDYAVIVDVTHGISPYTKAGDIAFEPGGGAAIAVGPNLHHGLTQSLIRSAQGLPYTIEVCAASSGTDAWVVQTAKKGIPCALISAPLRYMHSPVETICANDVDTITDIICGALKGDYICC